MIAFEDMGSLAILNPYDAFYLPLKFCPCFMNHPAYVLNIFVKLIFHIIMDWFIEQVWCRISAMQWFVANGLRVAF